MTESVDTTEETRTVREYRHKIRDAVRALPLSKVEGILRGVQGLSQEQQVERLSEATEALSDSGNALGQIRSIAEEARDYAAARDFEAHQAAKAQRNGYSAPADRQPEQDDEDDASTTD